MKRTMTVYGWKENGLSRKSFSMENDIPRKINFHVTLSFVWYKINYFLWKQGKHQLNYLS